jgi:type IV secretion system protein VirB1
MLDASGYNYSLGLAQINQSNFKTYGLTRQTAFDPCKNLAAGASILADCYGRAGNNGRQLGKALSCYNSGNFKTGFRTGYVAKVIGVRPAADPNRAIPLAAPSQPTSKRRRVDRPISETEALLTSSPTPTTQPADPAASTAFVF